MSDQFGPDDGSRTSELDELNFEEFAEIGSPIRNFVVNNRTAVVVVAAGLVALLAFGSLLLFGGGSGNPGGAGSPTTIAGGAGAIPSTGTPGSSTSTSTTLPVSAVSPLSQYQLFTSRNPFEPAATPIVKGTSSQFGSGSSSVPTSSSAGASATGQGGGSIPGGQSSPSGGASSTGGGTPGSPSGGTGGTGGGTGTSGNGLPSQPQVVQLSSIFTLDGQIAANVLVNGQQFQVLQGGVFDTNFSVIQLTSSPSCGTFLYGDYQFLLCLPNQNQTTVG